MIKQYCDEKRDEESLPESLRERERRREMMNDGKETPLKLFRV